MAINTTVTKRLIELNDEGIFVTSNVETNGKRLVEYLKKNGQRKKSVVNVGVKKKADQLCLKD